jgi:hypothetical protein
MSEESELSKRSERFEGYLLIPHELLHVSAYRLLGKMCDYQWGAMKVTPLESLSRRERLFVTLLPVVTLWSVGLGLYLLWLVTFPYATVPASVYLVQGPRWHLLLSVVATIFILYGGTCTGDILAAGRLLFGKETRDGSSN